MNTLYARRYIAPQEQYRRWIDPRVRALGTAEVIAYLIDRGWKPLPTDRKGYLAFQEPNGATVEGRPLCQFVPDTEDSDLPLRMFELVTGLAEVEDRQASAVIDDILRHASGQANGAAPKTAEPITR